jgi:taurine dioxygenase
MKTTTLEPIGVEVTEVSLRDIEEGGVRELRRLLADHGVLIMRGQHIDDAGLTDFLRLFGDLTFTTGETPVPGFPDLNIISNIGLSSPPRSTFHVDTSYVRRPPSYTALRAVRIPEHGGSTVFTNQYRAYDSLSSDLREQLAGRLITHVVSGLDLPAETETETSADHPVFRRHPISGRVALYLSTPQRCVAVSGMDTSRASEMITFLYAHSTRDENTYRHDWSAGDVVMWDNGCVMHKADHSEVRGDRLLHRGMVASSTDHGIQEQPR